MVEIDALEAKERLKKKLLEIEGVTGIGISSGSGPFLNIYVKKITEELNEQLPDEADGMPTRIIESGEINALPAIAGEELLALDVSRTQRMRPVRMGISIGNVGVSAGTAGMVVRDSATGKLGILSNAHVLVDYPPASTMEDPTVLQPGPHDGGSTADRICETTRWIPLKPTSIPGATNIVDCALCIPDNEPDISSDIIELGTPTGTQTAIQDMQVIKSGRSSGVTEATVLDTNADIKVGYGDFSAQFTDQIVTSVCGIPGDSGSATLNKANNRMVGLLFAGSDSITIHNKIHNVLSQLNVSVAGTTGNGPIQAGLGGLVALSLIGAGAHYLYKGGWK